MSEPVTPSPSPPPSPNGPYIPSPPALAIAVILSIGIVAIALRDSFTTDYDGRQTIVIFAVLIGGILGFDFRRGRWRGEDPPPSPPALERREPDE